MSERERSSQVEHDSGGEQVQTQRRPKPRKSEPRLMPPWKVMLHNDDENVFEDVIKIIQKLTPLNEQEAILRTLEAHTTGVALLLTTHRERAELYVEQFTSCGLTVTAERDES